MAIIARRLCTSSRAVPQGERLVKLPHDSPCRTREPGQGASYHLSWLRAAVINEVAGTRACANSCERLADCAQLLPHSAPLCALVDQSWSVLFLPPNWRKQLFSSPRGPVGGPRKPRQVRQSKEDVRDLFECAASRAPRVRPCALLECAALECIVSSALCCSRVRCSSAPPHSTCAAAPQWCGSHQRGPHCLNTSPTPSTATV